MPTRDITHMLVDKHGSSAHNCCSPQPLGTLPSAKPADAGADGEGPFWNLFAFPLHLSSGTYAFLTDIKSVVEITPALFTMLSGAHGRPVPDHLTQRQLQELASVGLVSDHSPAEQLRQGFARAEASPRKYELLHIITSYTCNLTCSYCFMLSDLSRGGKKRLSFEDARRGIDLFFSRPHKPDSVIHFYGGEPLLHPQLIEDCLGYIHRHYSEQVIPKIITNGTLHSPAVLDLLDRYDFDLSVSMDGDEKAHDVFRTDHAGRSTFTKTITGIKEFQRHGHNPKILVTVGKHNIKRLPEIVDYICGLRPQAIALNFPRELPTADNQLGDETAELSFWVDQYARSLDICFDKGIPELYFADMLFATLTDTPVLNPCAACGKQISVGPGAEIGPCQAFVASGKFSQPLTEFDEDAADGPFAAWKSVSKTMSAKCSRCPISLICGGDCSFDRYNRTGSLQEPLKFHCELRFKMASKLAERLVSGKSVGFTGLS